MTLTEQIKDKLDIVDFIGSYVQLKPAGKNLKGICPFHKERTPSFMVSGDRQMWHCFGSCSEGGDIIKFLMKYENIEFSEALKVLAEKAGIEIRRVSPMEQKQFGILYDINEAAKQFFKNTILNSREAQDYLNSRKLNKETIDEFGVGFAPTNPDELTLYLINLGYEIKDIERAGLNFKSERGGYFDRFRGRIMFPIDNHFGKTVGFSGRILPKYDNGDMGKYINSPETLIYNKSKILYGLSRSKNFVREESRAVLVEGQMDFLMLWQDGVKNIVATSGTALTGEHLKALRKQTDKLIFCFDNDEAGIKAAERSIELANQSDFSVNILILKDYKDPAEAVEKNPGLFKSLTQSAKPVFEFYFEKYLPLINDGDFSEIKKNIRFVLSKIKNISSPIEKSHWLKELADRTKMDEKALMEEMEKLAGSIFKKTAGIVQEETFSQKDRLGLIADRVISIAMAQEPLFIKISDFADYLPKEHRLVYEQLKNKVKTDDPGIIKMLDSLSLRSGFELELFENDLDKLSKEFESLLLNLKAEYLKKERENLMLMISEAEKAGDGEKLGNLLKKFDELSKIIQNV
ncbi:MAG: DNA primase [Candidatus Wolfebacteria bacterium]|nr:DNA primase [Candidatus Wolfebacteria bacterium]